jgi:hypothetical protein
VASLNTWLWELLEKQTITIPKHQCYPRECIWWYRSAKRGTGGHQEGTTASSRARGPAAGTCPPQEVAIPFPLLLYESYQELRALKQH